MGVTWWVPSSVKTPHSAMVTLFGYQNATAGHLAMNAGLLGFWLDPVFPPSISHHSRHCENFVCPQTLVIQVLYLLTYIYTVNI